MKLFCVPRGQLDGSFAVYSLLGYAMAQTYKKHLPFIAKSETGKPFFPDFPDIHFSLSHGKTHVLCCLSDNPAGVDIETVRPIPAPLPSRVCTPAELGQFEFFELWVLKESFIKLTGDTNQALKTICFSKSGEEILPPNPAVFAKLYSDLPCCRIAVCSTQNEFPEQITCVPYDLLFKK